MAHIYMCVCIIVYIYIYYIHIYSDVLYWHSVWHMLWHSIWHLFWHTFWHPFWHSFWHSIWHLFILSGIFSFWHSGILFWHSLCSGPGPTHSVRSSRYEVRVQAQSEHEVRATAQPGARDMRFGDELAHQWTREKSRRRRGRRRRSCTFVKI